MILIDERLLKDFGRKTACECCGTRGPVEAHHIFGRGFGGGTRLDIPENLVAICRKCHDGFHNRCCPSRSKFLAVAAAREGTTAELIVQLVYDLRRDYGGGEANRYLNAGASVRGRGDRFLQDPPDRTGQCEGERGLEID